MCEEQFVLRQMIATHSLTQETPCIIRNLQFNPCTHNSWPLVLFVSQMNPADALSTYILGEFQYFSSIYAQIFQADSIHLGFPPTTAYISMLPHACHMSCPSHNHSFVLPKIEVKLGVHHCAVLTSLLLLPYCPNSIHCPQHPILRHTLSNVLLLIRVTKLYTHTNNKKVVQHRPFQRTVPFRGPLKHFATCYVLL